MDVMGDARERIYFRAYGTAMSINEANSQKANESIPFPIVSLHTLPSFRFCGIGALISARNVHLIDEDNDSPASRAKFVFAISIDNSSLCAHGIVSLRLCSSSHF